MGSAKPQLEMVVDDPGAVERDQDDQNLVFGSLLTACRDAALAFGGYDKTANALDAIWSKQGRPVSPSFLRATLNPETREGEAPSRSYFRVEWIIWFARQSADVRDHLIGIATDAPKDPGEELDDVYDVLREDLGKTAEALIRKAKARRRRRR